MSSVYACFCCHPTHCVISQLRLPCFLMHVCGQCRTGIYVHILFQILSVALFLQSIHSCCFPAHFVILQLRLFCFLMHACCFENKMCMFFPMLSKLVSASQCFSSSTGIDKFVECANHVRVVICPEKCFRFGTALL